VQIEEGAGVNAFLMGEPGLLPRRGYGSIAAEAYGVTGSIVITPVLEVEGVRGELKICGGHGWPAFKRLELLETLSIFYASATIRFRSPTRNRKRSILSRMGNGAKSFIVAGWRGAALSATTYSGAELWF
jgi:hypothetical protein